MQQGPRSPVRWREDWNWLSGAFYGWAVFYGTTAVLWPASGMRLPGWALYGGFAVLAVLCLAWIAALPRMHAARDRRQSVTARRR